MSNSAPPGSPSKATPPPPSGTPAGSSPGGSGKGSPAPGNNNDKNSGANNKDNAKNNGDNSPTASNAGTSGGGGNNNNKNNGNNDGKNNTTPASPPPTKSPPPASPPPKNSKDGSNKTSPSPSPSPPSKSPPPSSPPPSSPTPSPPPKSPSSSPPPSSDSDQSSSSENSPPPLSQSEKSSPPSSSPPNQSSPPPNQSSDQPSGQSSPNTEIAPTGDPKWAPPPQAVSAPQPPGAPPVNPPAGGKATPHAVTPSGEHGSSPNSTSKTSPHTPQATNHPSGGTADSTTSSNGSDDGSTSSSDSLTQKTIIGATVAGVLLIAFIAIIFIVRRKKKQGRGRSGYPPHYISPPEKSDAYQYNQQYTGGQTGPGGAIDPFYGSQAQPKSPSENSHGSQRGHTLHAAGSQDSDPIGGSKSHFSYEELMEITNGFSRENIIGEGGFGTVYKGWLPDGRVVAVKQLKAGSGQGEREFRAEVEIISRVHHRHLVSLVGYCISEQHRSLIYEFVPNRTLEHHLHGKGMPVLDWSKRIKIALGAAKGLAYLHDDCHPKIIHRDIKSANILLDDVFEAQVADFGLAKLNDSTQTHVSTRVMGTFGYLAPEYANSGKLTDRSDVFSFGVVLLELITGRKPVDPTQPLGEESLVEWARPILVRALETGDISDVVDPRLEKHYVEGDVFRMIEAATACVRHSAPKRPRMVQVVRALDCEGDLSDLSNGVKYGQSTMYDSGQYNHDIMNFRRMALGCDDSSEFSGDYNSGSLAIPNSQTSSEFTSSESETRAMTRTKSPRGPHGPQF